MPDGNLWTQVLDRLKAEIDPEEFRRWFSGSSYASDSGDQLTVWVATAADGRHMSQNYHEVLQRALVALGRPGMLVRFVATGYSDDEDDE